MTHDEGVHEHRHDNLQDRREFLEAQGATAAHAEQREHGEGAALAQWPCGAFEHLLALRTDSMEVTVVAEATRPNHVVLGLVETRTGRGFSTSLTVLELEVLAFGLGRVAARAQRETDRR